MPVSPESLLSDFENDPSLFEPGQFALRLEVLDQLDAHFPESSPPNVASRTQALRARLEAANAQLYASIQREIQQGSIPAAFARELQSPSTRPAGLNYDYLDELPAGVFAFDQPGEARAPAGPENVFYQPTPARHIFALIREARLTAADTLIDLGSGLGHVPLLVSACTPARTIGIEFEPAYVAAARSCARKLNLDRASFQLQDAREADLSTATVVYLYTPFKGSILRTVLDAVRAEANLRSQSATHPIRIAAFGPCTHTLAQEPWLVPATVPAEDRITAFNTTRRTP